MDRQKSPLALGFLAAGFVVFAISFYFAYRASSSREVVNRLGYVSRESGQVSILRSGLMQKEKVERRSPIFHLDTIETDGIGEATIALESAYFVKVLDESLITIEKVDDSKGSHVVLIIKKGDLKVEGLGREGELFIAKNGERIAAADYESSPLKVTLVEKPTSIPTPPIKTSLTEEEISAVMTSNRSSFFKCYTQLLQKNPLAKGEVTVSFTIESSGKLSVYDLTSASLPFDDLKKCILEVMSRITFRPFTGAPVSTLFPIKFE